MKIYFKYLLGKSLKWVLFHNFLGYFWYFFIFLVKVRIIFLTFKKNYHIFGENFDWKGIISMKNDIIGNNVFKVFFPTSHEDFMDLH